MSLVLLPQENIHFDGKYEKIMEPKSESTKEDQIKGRILFIFLPWTHVSMKLFSTKLLKIAMWQFWTCITLETETQSFIYLYLIIYNKPENFQAPSVSQELQN